MALEHDFFGVVESAGEGGLRWEETVESGDQAFTAVVRADHDDVPIAALDLAAAMIRGIEGLDARARDALIAQLAERESETTRYIDRNVDDLGDDLADLLVHTSGDIAMDVLRSLQIVRLTIAVDAAEEGDAFAVVEYAIDPDEPDEPLMVAFDSRADVVAIDLGE